jgi:hypothetical protein
VLRNPDTSRANHSRPWGRRRRGPWRQPDRSGSAPSAPPAITMNQGGRDQPQVLPCPPLRDDDPRVQTPRYPRRQGRRPLHATAPQESISFLDAVERPVTLGKVVYSTTTPPTSTRRWSSPWPGIRAGYSTSPRVRPLAQCHRGLLLCPRRGPRRGSFRSAAELKEAIA